MKSVDIKEAKRHLVRLVAQACNGEPFIITKAGRPLVKVAPFRPSKTAQVRRLGFMAGKIRVPDDFDRMNSRTIERLFNGR